jgi:prepilin-type N-terminal cleavage/methylation domain-containing protein
MAISQRLLTVDFQYAINRAMNKTKRTSRNGFTLIELVVVIGILAVLLAIVLIAINPARQFAQANNTKRRSDVNAILNAVHQFAADNKGALPTGIDSDAATSQDIGDGTNEANICDQIMPTYISALPVDPGIDDPAVTVCTGYNLGYQINVDGDGRVTVSAEGTQHIPNTDLASPTDVSVMR